MTGSIAITAAALTGCTAESPPGPPEYLVAQVAQISDDVYAVGVEGRNVDEYAYARCVAANYAKYQEADSFAQLPGAPLHTRFLKQDGVRVTHSYGVLQFTVVTDGDDAPEPVLSVRDTLAECAKNGIPTKMTAVPRGAAGGATG